MKTLQHRYPGTQPFKTAQKDLFHGRNQETDDLLRLLRFQQTVVLHGKSGLGKSSLLNAGLMPAIAAAGKTTVFSIRFNAWTEANAEGSPLQKTAAHLLPPRPGALQPLADGSLWYAVKSRQLSEGQHSFLLIFDQFEELFTYPDAEVQAFKEGLAELLRAGLPQRMEIALGGLGLDDAALETMYEAADVKAIFSIRADRYSLMDKLSDVLPNILRHSYELLALKSEDAQAAIVEPAMMTGDFYSLPFTYEDAALRNILQFLRDDDGRVEAIQLQTLCQAFEKKVASGANLEGAPNVPLITADETEPALLKKIIDDYYKTQLADPSLGDAATAQRLIEDELVIETGEGRGVRVTLHELSLFAKFSDRSRPADEEKARLRSLLEALVNLHLVRRETGNRGGDNYELAHDRLIEAVLASKKVRVAAEAEARAAQEKAESARKLAEAEAEARREKLRAEEAERLQNEAVQGRRRARTLAWLAGVVAVVAIGLGVWANTASEKAKQETAKAEAALTQVGKEKEATEAQRRNAEANAASARQNAAAAEAANTLAQRNLAKARAEETRAKDALAQVEREKAATEAQRLKAEDNFRLAQEKTKEAEAQAETARLALVEQQKAVAAQQAALADVVRLTLKEADKNIYVLDYEGALEKMKSAAALGAAQREVSDALLEIAYFYAETGRFARAKGVLDTAAQLVGRNAAPDLSTFKKLTNLSTPSLKDFRAAIKTLHAARLDSLDARYFPTMLPIPGGTDTLGSEIGEYNEKPHHAVTLSPFKMARTETTWWQYNLFCEATGRKKPDRPGWGSEGDNPVVNVSWYGAVDYANWLSEREGAEKAIKKEDETYNVSLHKGGYRLPTEAEWEYAARAVIQVPGTVSASGRWTEYAGSNNPDEVAWYDENSGSRTHPVAWKKANGYGLYDMSGNVYEWCWDWYGDYLPDSKNNPTGADKGSSRLRRGGSWSINAQLCRVALRGRNGPDNFYYSFGFRLALALQ